VPVENRKQIFVVALKKQLRQYPALYRWWSDRSRFFGCSSPCPARRRKCGRWTHGRFHRSVDAILFFL